jgi:serine protease Do
MQSENIAKTVLITSTLVIFIIVGVLYLARDIVVDYLVAETVSSTITNEIVTTRTTEEQIVNTIEQVNPAVVSVVVTKDVPIYERYYEQYDPFGFFGGFSVPRVREQGTEEREVGGGSGFIVSNDGMIVTNRHVVSDTAARYSVLLDDGTAYEVEVLARDPQLDIAILKITEPLQSALPFVQFGDSESLRLGQTVIAIGNALAEFRNSVSVGVVSGLSRSIVASDNRGRSEQLDQVIQTDAAINPGNSGGPLLNLDGKVIGVNVATSRGADNIGFALPAHVVRGVVESVKEHGEIIRPFLGVRYTMVNNRIKELNDLSVDYGALVVRGETREELAVMPGSPADKAGITENTIILSIDGEELRERDLAAILRSKQVGQTITLRIIQAGEEKTVSATLEKAL